MTAWEGAARILVVDDDADIRRNLSDILTDLGYEVDRAQDGPAALSLVSEANPEARTILISGRDVGAFLLIQQTIEEGADAVCYKPLKVPELLKRLEELTGAQVERAGESPR
jgi:CheY-like chemotaxis protein